MAKLKLTRIPDDKPVRLTIELPAAVHRDLVAYAEAIGQESGQAVPEPAKLIVPMLQRFMATDRAFAKARRTASPPPSLFTTNPTPTNGSDLSSELSRSDRSQPCTPHNVSTPP